jgi:hypothetical protein
MLLSFERPGVRSGRASLGDAVRMAGERLFADLENCTAHHHATFPRGVDEPKQLGITDPKNLAGSAARGFRVEITVKIVRAHGGCLGT